MTYQVINPLTGNQETEFDKTTDEQVEQALQRGHQYYVEQALQRGHQYYVDQRQVGFVTRAKQLAMIADSFRQNVELLAKMAASNMGKLYQEGLGEANAAANIAQYYADNGPQALVDKPYTYLDNQKAVLRYESTGIVLAVEPWNFPYTQVMRVFAPNFLLGNPVILKHSHLVAGCADLFQELVWATDVDRGAFQNLFIDSQQVGKMIADMRVQGVALTGSANAGSAVAAEAGKAMTKSTLELGGNDAFVVLSDADVGQAVKDGATSRLRNAGQVCTSAKRFIVHQDVADQFIDGMVQEFESRYPGSPLDQSTTLAPLASKDAQMHLQRQVDLAVEDGAKVLVDGGAIESEPGNFFKPVLLKMTPSNSMYDEEFFGPVGQIYVVKDDEEAVALANLSQFGLAGAVYSQSPKHARTVANQMETGQIFINQPSNGYPQLPFGGIKNSGYGREMSDLALYEFANQKMIALG